MLIQRNFFTNLIDSTKLEYSENTASGIEINQKMTTKEADVTFAPLTDFLNKNLATLCVSLTIPIAKKVIKKIWDEHLIIIENILVYYINC